MDDFRFLPFVVVLWNRLVYFLYKILKHARAGFVVKGWYTSSL